VQRMQAKEVAKTTISSVPNRVNHHDGGDRSLDRGRRSIDI
jgi:hypothetical protein